MVVRRYVVLSADLRQAYPACRAVQEPHAQSILKVLNVAADHRSRDIEGRAAAAKPPFSTTLTKAAMLSKRSMRPSIVTSLKPVCPADNELSRPVHDPNLTSIKDVVRRDLSPATSKWRLK